MNRKKVSIAKLCILTLFAATTIGGCNMLIHAPRHKTEETSAGAVTYQTAYVPSRNFEEYRMIEYTVPSGDTSFKSYMDYRMITNENSEQYHLQEECWTDGRGLRRYECDYVIALGSGYAKNIGERFRITLESGEEFTAVVGDFKADCHTDETNRYTPMSNGGKNVIEFIVDTQELSSMARKMGDCSYAEEGFGGNVVSIEKYDQ